MTARVDEKTQFVDSGGEPIVNGFIYIGVQNADPKVSSISIFSDRALTIALGNPQRTDSQGRSVNKIWFSGRYSIKVEDVNNVQQFQDLDAGEATGNEILPLINVLGINTITADASPVITAYVDKAQFIFTVLSTNTGAVTLDISSVGAKDFLSPAGNAFISGELPAGFIAIVVYNSGTDDFYLLNPTNAIEATGNKTDGQILLPRFASTRGFEWLNQIPTLAKATTYTVVIADQGKLLTLSGASFTVTLPAAATAGDGFLIGFRHGGTSGTQQYTIDGNILALNGEVLWLVSDGTNYLVVYRSGRDEWLNSGSIDLTSGSPTSVSLASSLVDVNEIEVYIEGFSTDSDNQAPMFQIGDSGGLETSGYSGRGWSLNQTTYILTANSAGFFAGEETTQDMATVTDFVFILRHMGSNVWQANSHGSTTSVTKGGGGLKTLTGALDRLTLTTSGGSAVFDGGTAHVRSR